MKVLLEDKNQVVEVPDGLAPEKMEQELRKFYSSDELNGSTTFEERESYRLRKGRATVDDGKNWYSSMMGQTPIENAEQNSIRINAEFTQENDEKYSARNWPEKFVGATTELAPYMLDSSIQGAINGEAFGAAAASAALIGGQAGPQAAIPEEIITVPAAYASGRLVGQAWGTWMNAAKVEGGLLYKDMVQDGIDKNIARNVAIPAGYLIGAIELLQIKTLIPGFTREGIKSAIKASVRKGSEGAVSNVAKFTGRMAKSLAETTISETLQETTQEGISLTAEFGAGLLTEYATENGYIGPDAKEAKQRLTDTITQALLAFPLLGLPRSLHSSISLRGNDKFSARKITRVSQEAINGELSNVAEEASKYETFNEWKQSVPEEKATEEKTANRLGFDNGVLMDEFIWNASRDIKNEDAITKIKVDEDDIMLQEMGRPIGPEQRVVKILGKEQPKKITISETTALKESLRVQARAALQSQRATKTDLKDLKRGLVDAIKFVVPAEGQKNFLSMIANAEDGRDIIKVMTRVEKTIDEIQKKNLISQIKTEFKRVEDSKSIAVDYVQKIKDFIDEYELKGHQKSTLERLKATKDYIQSRTDAGQNTEMPKYILDSLDILSRKPIAELQMADLQDILSKLRSMAALGKTKLRSRTAIEKMRKSSDINNIKRDSKKIESKPLKEGTVFSGKLTPIDRFANSVKRVFNFAQEKDLAITPMDVVFDLLDGAKNYLGANYRIFKRRIDDAYSKYLDNKTSVFERIDKLSESLKLTEENMERIGIYAARMQEGGAEKLLSFFTQRQIDSISLNENETKFYNAMRKELDRLRPEIEKVMRETYNKPLGQVKNYFPFMTDFEAMSDYEIRDRFGDSVITYSESLRKNVDTGFTKERKGGKYKIKINAAEVFSNHVDNALYLINVGAQTKYLGELAATPEYREAVGDVGQETVREWIDLVARKGRTQGDRVKLLDMMRNYTGLLALGFKVSSAMIQVTALMDGAAMLGPQVFNGFGKVIVSDKWRAFVYDNMPEVRDRIADDPAFLGFKQKGWKTLTDIGYLPLKTIDKITATGVAAGAYIKYCKENDIPVDINNPNPEAVAFAQKMTRRTQSSAQFKDLPMAISKGKFTGNLSLDKMIFQFQSFLLNRWSMIRHDFWRAGILEKNPTQSISIATWLIAANFAESGIRKFTKEMLASIFGQELPEDDEDDDFYKNLGQAINNVPFVGSLYNSILYDSPPVPSISMMSRILSKVSAAVKTEDEDEQAQKAVKAIMSAVPGLVQFEKYITED